MAEEETDFTRLSTEDKCTHKNWKARLAGYEEAKKAFQMAEEKSSEWNKYLGLLKKFVIDSNAAAQEKGLEAVLAYLENAPMNIAGKTTADVVSGVVAKCLGAPKAKTKEKGIEIVKMYLEIEKVEITMEELIKGFSIKTPKVVTACIQTTRECLNEFGMKVVAIKPLVKALPGLLEDRDKGVRDEAKALAVEIYRWIGVALQPQLNSLKPVQLVELETEFKKAAESGKPCATRLLRSQQSAKVKEEDGAAGDVTDEAETNSVADSDVDPFDLLEPVNIIALLPPDFFEKCEDKKWQERKGALETLQQHITNNPKLDTNADYFDLVRILRTMVAKDANVMVVVCAIKCLGGLATGLRKKFQPHAGGCVPVLLEKFKEKKVNVVQALRETADAIYLTTTLESISDDVITMLDNKNPSIKAETALWLARCFCKCTQAVLTKKLLKLFIGKLMTTIDDMDPAVRDASADAMGTAMKVVSEKNIQPFIDGIDALKLAKVTEYCEKAVLTPIGGSKTTSSSTSTSVTTSRIKSAPVSKGDSKKSQNSVESKEGSVTNSRKTSLTQPDTATTVTAKGNKPARPASSKGGAKSNSKQASLAPQQTLKSETEISQEEADEKAGELFGVAVITGLADANWKTRLQSIEQISAAVKQLELADVPVQVVVKTVARKPGFKDTNMQVLKIKLDIVKFLCGSANFSTCSAGICIPDISDKLGDPKLSAQAGETLSAMADSLNLDHISSQTLEYAFNQKNPKTQTESLNWLSSAIKEFGFQLQVKPTIELIKKALQATNPAIRTAAVSLLGTLYLYMGPQLRPFFENEKPALLQQIDTEFEKLQDQKAPAPIRQKTKDEFTEQEKDDDSASSSTNGYAINLNDHLPKVDISPLITPQLLDSLKEKSWKDKDEALQKVVAIINDAKVIQANIPPDFVCVLQARLVDPNKNVVATAIQICQSLGTAMGANCKFHVKSLMPTIFTCFTDSKATNRQLAVSCLNAWCKECGLIPFMEGEIIPDALKVENPSLRSGLLAWLSEVLQAYKSPPSLPVADLITSLSYLYACVEDRNVDVRKHAADAILPFMLHTGPEQMARAVSKLKPASKQAVESLIEKAKPNLPVVPLKSSKTNGDSKGPVKASSAGPVKGTAGGGSKGTRATTAKAALTAPAAKKPVDDDCGPILSLNNLKDQRIIDEQKMKVLKWNFTTPREEFYELLKDQMAGNVSRPLIIQLFHSDFRFHLKALESLTECLEKMPDETLKNVDLIFKWLALRFFDTNPSVLLKGLEYVQSLCGLMEMHDYRLLDYEVNCFVPYLLLKIGDSKDAVKQGVHAIINNFCKFYPSSKLFAFVMDGLKSKNARQRVECLDTLGSFIETYGMSVCQPSASMALKEMAKNIADRDNSVRNAALNAVCQAFAYEGEKVYKLIGQLNEKDMSLLEERIKRTRRNPPAAKVEPALATASNDVPEPSHLQTPATVLSNLDNDYTPEPNQSLRSNQISTATITRQPKHVPIEDRYKLPVLLPHDDDDDEGSFSLELPKRTYRPLSPICGFRPKSASGDVNQTLDVMCAQIASNDSGPIVNALGQLDELLKDPSGVEILLDRVDHLVMISALQYRMQMSKLALDPNDDLATMQTMLPNNCYDDDALEPPHQTYTKMQVFRNLTAVLIGIFKTPTLATKASSEVLKDIVHILITIILDKNIANLSEGTALVMAVNMLVLRIVDYADPTNMLCALVQLLQELVGNEAPSAAKPTELGMKCIWKMVRKITDSNINMNFNLDRVLVRVDLFMKAYPCTYWKTKTSDSPMRTMKSVLSGLVKHYADAVTQSMARLDSIEGGEMEACIHRLFRHEARVIKKLSAGDQMTHEDGKEKSANTENVRESESRLGGRDGSRPTSVSQMLTHLRERKRSIESNQEPPQYLAVLADIFKKIGSREQTQKGLIELYELKLKYPNLSIDPFIRSSSQFFKSFVLQGLAKIDVERGGSGNIGFASTLTDAPANAQPASDSSPGIPQPLTEQSPNSYSISEYSDYLKEMRIKCGLDPIINKDDFGVDRSPAKPSVPAIPKSQSLTGSGNNSYSSKTEIYSQATYQKKEAVSIGSCNNPPRNDSGEAMTDLDALRRRLERIKNNSSNSTTT